MIVHVVWRDKNRRETCYETPYVACFTDPTDHVGERIVIIPTVDADERTIYMDNVKSVRVFDGGKEIRHYHARLEA